MALFAYSMAFLAPCPLLVLVVSALPPALEKVPYNPLIESFLEGVLGAPTFFAWQPQPFPSVTPGVKGVRAQ